MIAVLPAAGRGTRMAETTAGGPKELLKIDGKPLLRYAIEEAGAAGAERIIVVTSPAKPAIEEFVETAKAWCAVPITALIQPTPNGLAPAVAMAGGQDDAIVVLPDTLYHPASPTRRLAEAIQAGSDAAMAVETVTDELVGRYGIVEPGQLPGSVVRVFEKPQIEDAPSRWAVAGRYAFSARFMRFLQEARMNQAGETQLGPVINQALEVGLTASMVPLIEGEFRRDCGSAQGYAAARIVR